MLNLFKKSKKGPENIQEVLDYLKKLEGRLDDLGRKLEVLQKKSLAFFQKFGVVRFNPFKDVGGDQSFSIALLDANDNGFVVTSLYSRAENRVYAKPVAAGKSKYQLSEEEKEAIARATAQ